MDADYRRCLRQAINIKKRAVVNRTARIDGYHAKGYKLVTTDLICVQCGAAFQATPRTKYCKKSCSNRAHHLRMRERKLGHNPQR